MRSVRDKRVGLVNNCDEIVLAPNEEPLRLDPAGRPTKDLETAYRRLVRLYHLGHQIYSNSDAPTVFQTILGAAVTLLDVERAFLATVSKDKLVVKATYGLDLTGNPQRWPISNSMLRRVLTEGVSILSTDALQDARYGQAPSVDLHNIRSVMCCPIGTPRERRGLIYVDNRLHSGAFERLDLEFLAALSRYVDLALRNSEERQTITVAKELAEAQLEALRQDVMSDGSAMPISRSMIQVYDQARRAAAKMIPVLIVGETGTGKEVLARFIHNASPRAAQPLVPVHLGALPRSMVESELFGHEKGAFTGAERRRIGRLEMANHGTLFLDEVLDIPPEVQPKLLRVLEQRSFERLGSNEPIELDVRVICACNKPPETMIEKGVFREDLYYRLNSVILEIPPLRERVEDIDLLTQHFLMRCEAGKTLDPQARTCLRNYSWPGNVRELRNCILGLDALVEGPVIRLQDLPARMRNAPPPPQVPEQACEPLDEVIRRVERDYMAKALQLSGGNNEEAIRILRISRAKFFQRKKEFGL